MLHIGNFHVADGSARRQLLEISLEFKLGEGVDLFAYMHMVAVGNIILVSHARNDAETLLQAFGKAVGSGLHGGAIYGVADMFSRLPLGTFVVEALHDAESEFLGFRIRMRLAHHTHSHLTEAGIAKRDGGIAIVQKLVDPFPLFQAGQGAILP